MQKKKAIIIGAGPAGLTAAYELANKTKIKPVIFEESSTVGGISKTINYKGNRIDIGGHRFFSKSDTVMDWWLNIMPIEKSSNVDSIKLKYQGMSRQLLLKRANNVKKTNFLIRSRLSRIYYGGKFYNYPIKLELNTIKNLGIKRLLKIGTSYIIAQVFPKKVNSLEDFYINRFGRELYNTFFKDYTEKVWGTPCSEIAPDWGAQRVKGLSVKKALTHAVKSLLPNFINKDLSQKSIETSLIEYFLYPKHGPGQLWEEVEDLIKKKSGKIYKNNTITKLNAKNNRIISVETVDNKTKKKQTIKADYFFSTMPVKDLIESLDGVRVPKNVMETARDLPYRDFITVGVLVKKLKISKKKINDDWIYIQDPNVKVGRLQIFNNWSPFMVKNPKTIWIGMEYFVQEGDILWNKSKNAMLKFAVEELASIDIINKKDFLDGTSIRVKKTYPAYFGTYKQFNQIRDYVDKFDNLFLIGRNGQHRYNNQDHSMLTAMEAVNNIINNKKSKNNIWNVNIDDDYHEQK